MPNCVANIGQGIACSFGRDVSFEQNKQEVRFARHYTKAVIPQRSQGCCKSIALGLIVRSTGFHEGLIFKGSERGSLPTCCDIERSADPIQNINQMRGSSGPPNPFSCEPVDFRKSACDEHIVYSRSQLKPAIFRSRRDILCVGLIDDQENIGGQAAVEPLDFAGWEIASGWIVGVSQEHHFGPFAHSIEDGVDIRGVVAVGGLDRYRAAPPSSDVVDREAEAAEQHLVAGSRKALRGQIEQFIRSRAANNSSRIYSMHRAQGRAQPARVRIRIVCGAAALRESVQSASACA